jgi:hypothetical protein
VLKASADSPDETSVNVENASPAGVTALHYIRDWLLFATSDGALYVKKSSQIGGGTKASLVADGFSDIVSIATLDTFIYVADKKAGLLAIKVKDDGTFSQVKQVPDVG